MEDKQKSRNDEGKSKIINSIKTPLGFFSLLILVTEGILGLLAIKATGTDFTVLLISMLSIIIISILIVTLLAIYRPITLTSKWSLKDFIARSQKMTETEIQEEGVFLSSPMAGFSNDEEFINERAKMLELIELLQKECKFDSVYYAGNKIESGKGFNPAPLALKDDYDALKKSKYFLLIYPHKMVSSVLFEAGWALALGKESIYFVQNKDDLPFLMKEAAQAIHKVQIYTYTDKDDLLNIIKKHGCRIFT